MAWNSLADWVDRKVFSKCFQTTSFLTYADWAGGKNKILIRISILYETMSMAHRHGFRTSTLMGEGLIQTRSCSQHLLGVCLWRSMCITYTCFCFCFSPAGRYSQFRQASENPFKAFQSMRMRNNHAPILPSNLPAMLYETSDVEH